MCFATEPGQCPARGRPPQAELGVCTTPGRLRLSAPTTWQAARLCVQHCARCWSSNVCGGHFLGRSHCCCRRKHHDTVVERVGHGEAPAGQHRHADRAVEQFVFAVLAADGALERPCPCRRHSQPPRGGARRRRPPSDFCHQTDNIMPKHSYSSTASRAPSWAGRLRCAEPQACGYDDDDQN